MRRGNRLDTPVTMEQSEAELAYVLLSALRSDAAARPLVRRCLVHHVPLEHLACPTGLHPTEEEMLQDPNNNWRLKPDMALSAWEVVYADTGELFARVLSEMRVEYDEGPGDAEVPQLGGRESTGVVAGRTLSGSGKRGRGSWLRRVGERALVAVDRRRKDRAADAARLVTAIQRTSGEGELA
jgi:hypothetical protein